MLRRMVLALLISVSVLAASVTCAAAALGAPRVPAAETGRSFLWSFAAGAEGWWMNRPALGATSGQPATWNAGHLALDWPNFGGSYAWLMAWSPKLTTPLTGTRGRLRFVHQTTGAFANVEYRACLVGRAGSGQPYKVACTPTQPVGSTTVEIAVDPAQGAWTTEGSWPNGSSTPLPAGELAQLLHGVDRVYVEYRYGGPLCTDLNQKTCQWIWNTTTLDEVELTVWGPNAEVAFDTPNALAGDVVMLVARVRDADGSIVKASSEITATVTGYAESVSLDDALRRTDPVHGDGYHTALITVPAGQTSVAATVYYQGVELSAATLSIVKNPKLAVVTDFSRLTLAFRAAGSDPAADTDADGRSDLYQLIDRLRQYAQDHAGVVYDLGHNITVARGFSANYADYDYAAGRAGPMSGLAFQFITSMHAHTQYSVRAIALIGSDEVVPMYRMPYPLVDNRTLASDVPYMLTRYVDPEAVPHPVPQVPAGRVFGASPTALRTAIDAYEQPLTIGAAGAGLLCIDQEQSLIQWDNLCRTLVAPRLAWHYPGATSIFREAVAAWGAQDVVRQLARDSVTVLYSHADMTRNRLPGEEYFTAGDIRSLSDAAGKLMLNAGCWTGNHPAYSAGSPAEGLVSAVLDRHLTYTGPTDTGVGGNYTLVWDDYIWMHFLDALWQPRNTTVGAAWIAAWNGYYAAQDQQLYQEMGWDIDGTPRVYTISQAYAKSLTGLPTQPVQRPGQTVALNVDLQPAAEPPATAALEDVRSETIALDVPNYRWTTHAGGAQQALPATGGTSWGRMGLPVLPALDYRLDLPPQVTNLTVVETPGTRQVERIGAMQLVTETTDIRCNCAQPAAAAVTSVVTSTYPLAAWTSDVDAQPGAAVLNLFTVLGQVDSRSVLTLTHHIEFTVKYTQPATGVTLGPLTVNNSAPVRTDAASVPVRFSLSADRARSVLLMYSLSGGDGLAVAAGSSEYGAHAGSQDVTLTLGAGGWPAGPLYLQVTAADAESDALVVLDRRGSAVRAAGLGVAIDLTPWKVEQGALLAVSLDAWDERGAPVDGLEGRFTATVDQGPGALVLTRVAPGRYAGNLPSGTLPPGSHSLAVEVTDTRGFTARTDTTFGVTLTSPAKALLPLVRR